MKYLVDTNIWLEVLLAQEKYEESQEFLTNVDSTDLVITEFSLYSIGLALSRLGKIEDFQKFLKDILEENVQRVILLSEDLMSLPEISRRFKLDFDDAYQYLCAKIHNLLIVSFDSDFDRTDIGRKTPSHILKELKR